MHDNDLTQFEDQFGDDQLGNSAAALILPVSERRLPPLLRRVWYRLNQTFRRRIAHLELTPDQYTVLRWLTENPRGITQKELSELMASDSNTMTATLQRMEQAKLISREPNVEDRREKILRIKALGRRKYMQACKIAHQLQVEISEAIPEQERDQFIVNLARLANACDTAFGDT
jgi:DNA-binding MarR family transcriptional regulator